MNLRPIIGNYGFTWFNMSDWFFLGGKLSMINNLMVFLALSQKYMVIFPKLTSVG